MNSPSEEAATLKVRTVSIIVLEVHSTDLKTIDEQIRDKANKGAGFFNNVPLLVDLGELCEEFDLTWLLSVNTLLASRGFIPVGITGAPKSFEEEAQTNGIIIWSSKKAAVPEPAKPEEPQPEKDSVSPVPTTASVTQIIDHPVRSGQRVYAKGSDLIVMSTVNPGGEVMADGNIHIYGSLKGRALAGVSGREDVRIFCQDLQAELVAIAGYYTINEDLPSTRRNTAVKMSLKGESLEIDPLIP
ncbi:septum site-determining protein MinC [Desulforhopalus sp. IMCC35007]|uniref:septum site-determining protein MinC n=1 Tax=Desulforhopalus sp. IMCC35007 TaxID=2569543 RepID=UPI00145E3322|nr:septum site-determining protein MinC [Desulforhopalus sp. IMCC35007]